jgi:hypothetical protein
MCARPRNRAKVISIGAGVAEAAEHAAAPSLTDEGLAIDTLIVSHIDPVEEPMERGDKAARASRKLRGAEVRAANDDDSADDDAQPLVRRRPAPRYERSHIREAKLPYYIPKPRANTKKNVRHALTGYYISRDTIYGPERSGEFYVRDACIYLSRRSLGTRADIPGAAARELGRTLGDLAGVPRASGTVANRVAGRHAPPTPTGYFTINGQIYGGVGLASDAIAGTQKCSAQLAKGEFRIIGNLIYGPPGRRVPWLTATAASAAKPAATPAARVRRTKAQRRQNRTKAA